jgi:hypothetical protein
MAGTAGQEPDLGMAAHSGIGLENTLKVETRVRIPLGLRNVPRRLRQPMILAPLLSL